MQLVKSGDQLYTKPTVYTLLVFFCGTFSLSSQNILEEHSLKMFCDNML